MKTKALPILITFLLSVSLLNAQDEEPQYLFQNTDISISGFGAFFNEFSSVQNDFAVSNGGGGAVIFNQKFYFGGYGMGLSTIHERPDLDSIISGVSDSRISFGHGGLWLGYIHNSHKAVHFSVSSKFGWGQIAIYDKYYDYHDREEYYARDNVFVITPQIEMEMNLTPWFKMNIGAGYRYVAGIDKAYILSNQKTNYYESNDFSSPTANISLLFGGFGK